MMPKKATKETAEQQAERFRKAVQDMIDAGELSPTDADAAFDGAMAGVTVLRERWLTGEAAEEEAPESSL